MSRTSERLWIALTSRYLRRSIAFVFGLDQALGDAELRYGFSAVSKVSDYFVLGISSYSHVSESPCAIIHGTLHFGLRAYSTCQTHDARRGALNDLGTIESFGVLPRQTKLMKTTLPKHHNGQCPLADRSTGSKLGCFETLTPRAEDERQAWSAWGRLFSYCRFG